MEDTNQVEKTEQVEETKAEDTRLTQDQVDEAIANRLTRERKKFAEKLGLEKYDDESLDGYLAKVKDKNDLIETQKAEIEKQAGLIEDRDFKLAAIEKGVTSENVARAIKLAKTELSGDVDINQALDNVLGDFPMLKGVQKKKVGSEVDNTSDSKTEVDRYLENRYKDSKYYKN